jgi:dihydroorotase
MSKIVLKSVLIFDKNSPFHKQKKDVSINKGQIEKIAVPNSEDSSFLDAKIFDADGLYLSVGWFDMRAVLSEPGFEHKDTLDSFMASASFGGFTDVAILPNTQPLLQEKDLIEFIKYKSGQKITSVHPIACLSKDCKEESLSEILDLHFAGAVAFSDGLKSSNQSGLMLRALQYLQSIDGLLMNFANEKALSTGGQMHEGAMSTSLGMKGLPAVSEEIAIQKAIQLLEYTGGKIHFSTISTRESVKLIRQAKEKGLAVTCDVAAYQLVFLDEDLLDFDTNFKVMPPLRSQSDQNALWEGLADGTIDAIVSNHIPQDEESKKLEFNLADFGMLGLETAFGLLNLVREDKLSLEQLIQKWTVSPREILKQNQISIAEGETAKLTLFDPEKEWVFEKNMIQSKSKNSPCVDKKLKGKVVAVFNQNKSVFWD